MGWVRLGRGCKLVARVGLGEEKLTHVHLWTPVYIQVVGR